MDEEIVIIITDPDPLDRIAENGRKRCIAVRYDAASVRELTWARAHIDRLIEDRRLTDRGE